MNKLISVRLVSGAYRDRNGMLRLTFGRILELINSASDAQSHAVVQTYRDNGAFAAGIVEWSEPNEDVDLYHRDPSIMGTVDGGGQSSAEDERTPEDTRRIRKP